jgi:hypothetical protein
MTTSDEPIGGDETLDTELASSLAAALSGLTVPVFVPRSGQELLPERIQGEPVSELVFATFHGDKLVLVEPKSQLPRAGALTKVPEAALTAIVRAVQGTLWDTGAFHYTPTILHIASVVERSLPGARRQASEAMIEKMIDALIETQDPTAQVRAEIDAGNAKARMRFMNNFLTLTAEEVAENAGSRAQNRHQAASRWKKEGKIFSIPWQGYERYPAFQFKDGRPLPAIASVLANLPRRMSPWETAFWFVSTNGWLGGKAPRELLDSPKRLAEAARRESDSVLG